MAKLMPVNWVFFGEKILILFLFLFKSYELKILERFFYFRRALLLLQIVLSLFLFNFAPIILHLSFILLNNLIVFLLACSIPFCEISG